MWQKDNIRIPSGHSIIDGEMTIYNPTREDYERCGWLWVEVEPILTLEERVALLELNEPVSVALI